MPGQKKSRLSTRTGHRNHPLHQGLNSHRNGRLSEGSIRPVWITCKPQHMATGQIFGSAATALSFSSSATARSPFLPSLQFSVIVFRVYRTTVVRGQPQRERLRLSPADVIRIGHSTWAPYGKATATLNTMTRKDPQEFKVDVEFDGTSILRCYVVTSGTITVEAEYATLIPMVAGQTSNSWCVN